MKISNYCGSIHDDVVLTSIAYGIDAQYRFCVWVMQVYPFCPSIFIVMESCPPEQARDWWHNVICKQDINKRPSKCYAKFLNQIGRMTIEDRLDAGLALSIILVEDITYQKLRDIMERTLPCHFMWMNHTNFVNNV